MPLIYLDGIGVLFCGGRVPPCFPSEFGVGGFREDDKFPVIQLVNCQGEGNNNANFVSGIEGKHCTSLSSVRKWGSVGRVSATRCVRCERRYGVTGHRRPFSEHRTHWASEAGITYFYARLNYHRFLLRAYKNLNNSRKFNKILKISFFQSVCCGFMF